MSILIYSHFQGQHIHNQTNLCSRYEYGCDWLKTEMANFDWNMHTSIEAYTNRKHICMRANITRE